MYILQNLKRNLWDTLPYVTNKTLQRANQIVGFKASFKGHNEQHS